MGTKGGRSWVVGRWRRLAWVVPIRPRWQVGEMGAFWVKDRDFIINVQSVWPLNYHWAGYWNIPKTWRQAHDGCRWKLSHIMWRCAANVSGLVNTGDTFLGPLNLQSNTYLYHIPYRWRVSTYGVFTVLQVNLGWILVRIVATQKNWGLSTICRNLQIRGRVSRLLPDLHRSKVTGFQESKVEFFLTPPAQEIETQ